MQRNALMPSPLTIQSKPDWSTLRLLPAFSTTVLLLSQGYTAPTAEAKTLEANHQQIAQTELSSDALSYYLAQADTREISWPWRRNSTPAATPAATPVATPSKTSQRRRPKPPGQGTYVSRRGGASRSCGDGKSLMALVPTEQLGNSDDLLPQLSTGGFTTQAKPDFWFEVPFELEAVDSLEFVLQDSDDEDLYRGFVSPQKGLVKMVLPETVAGLEVGDRYSWYLKAEVRCTASDNPEKLDSKASLQQVKGWVERYEAPASINQRLQAASPQQQSNIYASEGIWFDAMNLLMQLQQEGPADASLQNDWAMLLSLYGLDAEP